MPFLRTGTTRGVSLLNLSLNVTMDRRDYGAFTHDEADITMIAYRLQFSTDVIKILSGDTDVLAMLVR